MDVLKEVIHKYLNLQDCSTVTDFPLAEPAHNKRRAIQPFSETGNKQILLRNLSSDSVATSGCVILARGLVSVLLSVTVTRNLHSRLSQIVWGLWGVAAPLSQGFMCVEMVTDLACAETVHHLFDPWCLSRPPLWPSHSSSANRSVWHPLYMCAYSRVSA